uniref:Uncharacterized protein n=1 Tax=Anguilla anguilla TaxID=7936 RepID=A0A0E9TN44_ANGAN
MYACWPSLTVYLSFVLV